MPSAQQYFGKWGLGLDVESFAAALAELGVATRQPGAPAEHDQRDRVLLQHQPDPNQLARGRLTLRWSPDRFVRRRSVRSHDPAANWAAAWRALGRELPAFCAPGQRSIRLEIETGARRLDPQWLAETLSRAPGVSSVTFVADEPGYPKAWDWPIDIGFLDDEASRRLRAELERQYWDRFVRFRQAAHATSQIDVLMLPHAVPEAVSALLRARRPAEVYCVLSLGGLGHARDPLALLNVLRHEADALAAGALRIAAGNRHQWLDAVLFSLSHNRTLDEAIFQASGSIPRAGLPLLLGARQALDRTRASEATIHVCARAKARLSDQPDPPKVAKMASPAMAAALAIKPDDSPKAVAERVGAAPEDLPWSHEGEAATMVANVAGAADEVPDPQRDNRLVQGRIFALREGKAKRILKGALAADAEHRLDIRIAAPDSGWVQAPVAFPTDRLPADPNGHELTVVLTDPGLLPEPVTNSLWLPATGNSKPCQFFFSTGGRAARLDARVTVLYRNHILQTLRFKAPIAGRVSPEEEAKGVRISVEAVLRRELQALSGTPKYDAALLFNETAQGGPGLTAVRDKKAVYVSLGDLAEAKRRIKDEIDKIAKRPLDYGDPGKESTRKLLVTLARFGAGFYKAFAELPGIDAVLMNSADATERRARRLQLLSLHADDVLALEFCYDQKTPDEDASACPEWPNVLTTRPSSVRCPHEPCSQNLIKTVCPVGFWGLVDTIERHMYNSQEAAAIQDHGATFEVRCEAVDGRQALPPVKRVLLGAADKAKAFDPKEFQKALDSMKDSLSNHGRQMIVVQSWGELESEVRKPEAPDVLLLIAHTEEIAGASTLQIGTEALPSTRIDAPQVHLPPIVPPQAGPVVLLFGCRTADEQVPFAHFVGAFRTAGASVVVATLSTVLGRHMAPAARETLDVLLDHAESEAESFGDVIVDIRRRLLAHGLPIGLTFVAFGDASWQLGGTT